MIEKEELELFINKYCRIILNNGYSYAGYLRKVTLASIVFEDRFDGLKVFDTSIITSIGEVKGGQHDS